MTSPVAGQAPQLQLYPETFPDNVARLRARLALLEFKRKAALTDGYIFGAQLATEEIARLQEKLLAAYEAGKP